MILVQLESQKGDIMKEGIYDLPDQRGKAVHAHEGSVLYKAVEEAKERVWYGNPRIDIDPASSEPEIFVPVEGLGGYGLHGWSAQIVVHRESIDTVVITRD